MNFPAQTIDAPVRITFITLLIISLSLGCGKQKEEPTKVAPKNLIANPIVGKALRKELKEPTGELTKADLEKVELLDLSVNQLSEVPEGLENLTKLTVLNIYENKLTDVKGLEKLTQLDYLSLGSNQLTDLKGLEKLAQLTNLNLSSNQLTEVPKELEKLTQLRELWLDDNQLTSVKGLENLTKLEELYLHASQLTDVKGLERLTQLKNLWLDNNPDLTKAQIDELQKALPKCRIFSNPTK